MGNIYASGTRQYILNDTHLIVRQLHLFGSGLERVRTTATLPWISSTPFTPLTSKTLVFPLTQSPGLPSNSYGSAHTGKCLWVVQEALLGKRATINCGQISTDIENFTRLKEIELKFRGRTGESLQPMQFGEPAPLGLILLDWAHYKALIAQGQMRLFVMISTTGASECENPLDKIFGLLGICTEDDGRAIAIDYVISCRELVTKVIKYFLRKSVHSPLSYLQTHQETKRLALPS
jgi:hypothetical protein